MKVWRTLDRIWGGCDGTCEMTPMPSLLALPSQPRAMRRGRLRISGAAGMID